ncbi:MAG: hypothetical protein CL760_01900 [Chloroflexi bacterium]|nr:hypothetical protein [Chloroflexota bacterium]|tara:strand:- start:2297 stop:2980 length:684 start_codon:yes stop_codon:yes gene_type:complete
MSKNNKNVRERFFTIVTPSKDGSVLDQFLSEFGYAAFESENRPEDTRRSVNQISTNEELMAELEDFCNEYGRRITLIYKEKNQLMQRTYQGSRAYKPKPYAGSEEIANELQQQEEKANKALKAQQNQKKGQKKNRRRPPYDKNNQSNKSNQSKDDQELNDFVKGKKEQKNGQKNNQRRYNNNNKNRKQKQVGVMQDKPMREVSDQPTKPESNANVTVKKKRVINKPR